MCQYTNPDKSEQLVPIYREVVNNETNIRKSENFTFMS